MNSKFFAGLLFVGLFAGINLLSTGAVAAPKKVSVVPAEDWSLWVTPHVDEANKAILKMTFVPAKGDAKRKLAQAQELTEGDLKPDVKAFREFYLKAKTPDDLQKLLVKADAEWKNYSPDLKYFSAQLILLKPLRGLVWRMRPLFETGSLLGGTSGNKATHGAAVHMLRQIATGVDTFLPTEQWQAGFDYVTQPSSDMTVAMQFRTVRDFQRFLTQEFMPALKVADTRVLSVVNTDKEPTLVWDRQMVYGPGKFVDGARRYVGFGPAEVYLTAAAAERAMHDALVFNAYNQDDLMNVIGKMGQRFGIESTFKSADMGVTALQRNSIVMDAVRNRHFLELQDYGGARFGSNAMSSAYEFLQMSTANVKKAYDYLSADQKNGEAFALNPMHFHSDTAPKLGRSVDHMFAAVNGKTDVRDPVSGEVVTLNLPDFYNNPYKSLGALMANGFDSSKGAESTLVNAKGEKLVYRNYSYNSSNSWDNSAWKKIVPSADGKSADYMNQAKRVIDYSLGTSWVTGEIALFVR